MKQKHKPPQGGRVPDTVIIIDGVLEDEKSEKELISKLYVFLNAKFSHVRNWSEPDISGAERIGLPGGRRARSIRMCLNSEWHKRSLMTERKTLKGTMVFFNEELSKEMQDLDYRARINYKSNALPKYLTHKDHVLMLQGQGQKRIKVYNQEDMDNVLSTFNMMNFQGDYVPPHLRKPPHYA